MISDAVHVPKVALNTAHAMEMLRARYAPPEWAYMEEVAPSTGGGTRYADAVAVNLWSSRGHAIYGFEVKVSRSDWLRELKKPAKAEQSVFKYCDRWFVVAPKGVVNDGELPVTWGLLELRDSGLFAKVEAPKLDPQPISKSFFASLMRRGHEQINKIAERINHDSIQQAILNNKKCIEEEVERRTRHLKELQEQISRLEKETGLSFCRYSGPPIGVINLAKKLQSLSNWNGLAALDKLSNIAQNLEQAAKTVRDAIESSEL